MRLAILGYIPGSFDAEEARAMLGEKILIKIAVSIDI